MKQELPVTGYFGAASSATATSLRVPSYSTPKGAPPASPLALQAQASPGPLDALLAGFACTEQLRTRLELRGVPHQENPTLCSAAPCRCSLQTQADPTRYHIPAVCPRAVAGRETVDASETWHRETAQGGEKEGQPYLSQTLLLLAHSHAAPLRFLSVP